MSRQTSLWGESILHSKKISAFLCLSASVCLLPAWAADTSSKFERVARITNSIQEGRTEASSSNPNKESKPGRAEIVIAKDTKIPVVMDSIINSDSCMHVDEFSCKTAEDVNVDGETVISAGSVIQGRVFVLIDPNDSKRKMIKLKFDRLITSGNQHVALDVALVCRGGVVHVHRGLKDIVIEVCHLPGLEISGGQLCSWGGKAVRPRAVVKNNGRKKVPGEANYAFPAEFNGAFVPLKGHTLDIEVGDAMKIELTKDLTIPAR